MVAGTPWRSCCLLEARRYAWMLLCSGIWIHISIIQGSKHAQLVCFVTGVQADSNIESVKLAALIKYASWCGWDLLNVQLIILCHPWSISFYSAYEVVETKLVLDRECWKARIPSLLLPAWSSYWCFSPGVCFIFTLVKVTSRRSLIWCISVDVVERSGSENSNGLPQTALEYHNFPYFHLRESNRNWKNSIELWEQAKPWLYKQVNMHLRFQLIHHIYRSRIHVIIFARIKFNHTIVTCRSRVYAQQ